MCTQSQQIQIQQFQHQAIWVNVTYSVHIQGVHGEVIRVQVQWLKKLLHGYFFPLKLVHDAVSIHAVGFFDEAQQMLLVHAGGSVDVGVHLEGDRRGDAVGGFGHKRELKGHGQYDSTQSTQF